MYEVDDTALSGVLELAIDDIGVVSAASASLDSDHRATAKVLILAVDIVGGGIRARPNLKSLIAWIFPLCLGKFARYFDIDILLLADSGSP